MGDLPFPLEGGLLRPGEFSLVAGEVRALRRSGWLRFSLLLADGSGAVGADPVVRGIYSRGGKDGVRPWMDIEYAEEIPLPAGDAGSRVVSLAASGLDSRLFRLLGDAIPPGGHLMVSYEDEQPVHRDTMRALGLGVPPAATPLGFLLFLGGFSLVKDWYLAEGGMEGPRKLWGEKAPDPGWERTFRERTLREVRRLPAGAASGEAGAVLAGARERAAILLGAAKEPL